MSESSELLVFMAGSLLCGVDEARGTESEARAGSSIDSEEDLSSCLDSSSTSSSIFTVRGKTARTVGLVLKGLPTTDMRFKFERLAK